MGKYDVPACIDYVLEKTLRSALIYIGHSMGGGIFYMAMANYPQLNAKIDAMISLAPSASMANMNSPLKKLAPHTKSIQVIHISFYTIISPILTYQWTKMVPLSISVFK